MLSGLGIEYFFVLRLSIRNHYLVDWECPSRSKYGPATLTPPINNRHLQVDECVAHHFAPNKKNPPPMYREFFAMQGQETITKTNPGENVYFCIV